MTCDICGGYMNRHWCSCPYTERGGITMFGNDGGGSSLGGEVALVDRPKHWWYR